MTDARPATSASPDRIMHLRATSGRDWHLRLLRPLAANVQLVQDITRPSAPPVVVKTVSISSASSPASNAYDNDLIRSLVDDASVWHRAHLACPDFILPLLDLSVQPPLLHYITPYCPAGHLSAPRPERSALRLVSAVASAVDVVLSTGVQSAHGNVSCEHVLIDQSGMPKLAGWGLTRYFRLNPSRPSSSPPSPSSSPPQTSSHITPATERDDVIALARLLYVLLFNRPFDTSPATQREDAIPEHLSISSTTRTLLSSILIHSQVPQLHVFRYDLNSARGLLPVCGPALPPAGSGRKREQLLDADLDSIHGLDRHSRVTVGLPPHAVSPLSASSPPDRASQPPPSSSPMPLVARHSPPSEPLINSNRALSSFPKPPPASPPIIALGPSSPETQQLPENASIQDIVRAATIADLSPPNDTLADRLLDMCIESDDDPLRIFKILFRLPISKNPLLAFKSVYLLHRFVAEGPAKLTAQTITNDGFLGWIESSWTRERIPNKPGKMHAHTHCFASGEIAWYTSLIRKRCQVHAKFAESFTTHWIIRPAGSASLSSNRKDAFRTIVDVVEKCSAVLRKAIISKDPAADLKRSAVPSLVSELTKTYTVLCWLYCTASTQQQAELISELSVAHNATRTCMTALHSDEDLVSQCHPASLLELPESPATSFNEADLIATLKRLKKRKKRKLVSSAESKSKVSPAETVNDCEAAPEVEPSEEDQDSEQGSKSRRKAPVPEEDSRDNLSNGGGKSRGSKSDSDSDNDSDHEESGTNAGNTATVKATGFERERYRREAREVVSKDPGYVGNGVDWRNRHGPSPPDSRISVPVSGLRKLSVSVRRGDLHNGIDHDVRPRMRSDAHDLMPPPTRERRTDTLRADSDDERRPNERRRQWTDVQSDSEEEYDHSRSQNGRRGEKDKKGIRARRKKPSSDSDTEDGPSSDEGTKQRVSRKKKSGKAVPSDNMPSSDGGSEENKRSEGHKKSVAKKKHLDEKSIPFDRTPPSKRSGGASKRSAGSAEVKDDYSGGSKEALAAAAEGRKTPNMNPDFEVAPYEVQFGPQIGSGGFGVVHKAKFRNETVAVKKIHAHALSNAASVGEFQSEVAVLCTLRHPNILRFVGACTKPPNLMIITEFMSRGTLFDLLHQSQARVTWPMRKKFALDTCKGMRYLHDSKLLHRDLKSSNLMLDKDMNCKVGDFGLTRISKGSAAVQMTGQCGTFQYMAVEVLANRPYSEKADVFSFGILLWEMVARKLPFFGMQPMQVGLAVLNQGLRPTIPPKTPLPLCNMMRACWDSDPLKRPSFAQLVDALEAMPE